MYVIIVGANPLGLAMTGLCHDENHNVVLIEEDEQRAQAAARSYDAMVLHASISEGDILEQAKADRADAMVAVTHHDTVNLMAMVLGREYGIERLISVVAEAEHEKLFQSFDVEVIVGPEGFVAKMLYNMLRQPVLEDVVPLRDGAQVSYLSMAEGSPLVGRSVGEVVKESACEDLIFVSLRRGEEQLPVSPETQFEQGDYIGVFSPSALSDEQLEMFEG